MHRTSFIFTQDPVSAEDSVKRKEARRPGVPGNRGEVIESTGSQIPGNQVYTEACSITQALARIHMKHKEQFREKTNKQHKDNTSLASNLASCLFTCRKEERYVYYVR
ncbi:hypothetical protein BgiBS90_023819 [Biomphalaria glabrata]|nr:hypothetical protein BgiBS90_023819 [Biomphalaria glabrata]